ncbi:MAG TPA: 2'-5' RNA ligase family protein [Actinomycetes bacterium]
MPAAEAAVGDLRRRLDPSAALGVPAHVTIHFPWVPDDRVDARVLDDLATLAAEVASFDVTLRRTAWFDRELLWLDPEPREPFLRLIAGSASRWPDLPLYGGQFADVVPHVTVGIAAMGSLVGLDEIVGARLPVGDRATELQWITRTAPDPWIVRCALALG